MNLSRTLSIASMTIEENLRKRILYILLFLSFILIAASSIINTFNLGAQVTVIKDLSLSGISFFGILFTISLFLNAIPGEIDQKTIYPLLSQPITRADYLWGKFIGIFSLISINLLVLGIELVFVLYPHEGFFNFNILQSVALIILQCGILGAMIILFSLIMSYPLTISVALFLYIVGNLSSIYISYIFEKLPLLLVKFIILIKLILPKFDILNVKSAVVHNHALNPAYLPSALVYGILYIIATMILAEIVFENKDL